MTLFKATFYLQLHNLKAVWEYYDHKMELELIAKGYWLAT